MKYVEPLKTLNCGVGGDRVPSGLWQAQNLPVILGLKNAVILGEINRLFLDLPEDIADGIIEIVQTFQCSCNSINIAIGGILPRDSSWSINRVLIKEINEIPSHSLYTSATIVFGLLQVVYFTQTSFFG